MMKKLLKIIVCVLCFLVLANNVFGDSESLKDLKDKLAQDIANKDVIIAKKAETQKKINSLNDEIAELNKQIEECKTAIEESKAKIEELNIQIEEKNKEIESLLSFKQVSDGDNVYLEYIFGASSFTDFIYRSALVEQLTNYNDELIDEMYDLIQQNVELQAELNVKIEESENKTIEVNNKLKSYGLTLSDLFEDQEDVEQDINARQTEIIGYEALYKQNNCEETQTIQSCIGVPYASGFVRPLETSSITSNYGMRFHPTKHQWLMHDGIDLSARVGTNVYAVAAGRVSKISMAATPNIASSSCGGNKVYIQHTVDGKNYTSVYMHLHTVNVKVNDIVTIMTVIGTSGGGESYDYCTTGGHLHLGLMIGWTSAYYVDPTNYINFPPKGTSFYSRFY